MRTFADMTRAEVEDLVRQRNQDLSRLRAVNATLLDALEALLPVAQAFEKQASRGTGGRRGGLWFEKARAAIAKAKAEPCSATS